jgi:hypothetical protein
LPGQGLAGVVGEGFQQGKLPGRQAYCPPAGRDLTPQQVDADAAGLQRGERDGRRTGPEISPHAGQELFEGEWLAQVVISAEVESPDPVAGAPPGAEHQDWDRRSALAQVVEHVKAVQVGQAEVQDQTTRPCSPPAGIISESASTACPSPRPATTL